MNIEHGNYKHRLKEDFRAYTGIHNYTVVNDWFSLRNDGLLILKKGYAWNGATAAIDTDNFLEPSAVHDAFYQMIKDKSIPDTVRLKADQLLKKMCLKAGMSSFRAHYVYLAVRAFGGKFAR